MSKTVAFATLKPWEISLKTPFKPEIWLAKEILQVVWNNLFLKKELDMVSAKNNGVEKCESCWY